MYYLPWVRGGANLSGLIWAGFGYCVCVLFIVEFESSIKLNMSALQARGLQKTLHWTICSLRVRNEDMFSFEWSFRPQKTHDKKKKFALSPNTASLDPTGAEFLRPGNHCRTGGLFGRSWGKLFGREISCAQECSNWLLVIKILDILGDPGGRIYGEHSFCFYGHFRGPGNSKISRDPGVFQFFFTWNLNSHICFFLPETSIFFSPPVYKHLVQIL